MTAAAPPAACRRLGRRLVMLGALLLWAANTSLFSAPEPGRPLIIAHRGVAQTFSRVGLTGETCTAAQMVPSSHRLLENTLPSMAEAFRLGADLVEFDVQPTNDGAFVVFHDWTLDCRTDGHGRTRDHRLAELRGLDLGHGYTADGGRTFPLRGSGVGMMPTLEEVLDAFPGERFLLNVKSDDPAEGRLLVDHLTGRPDLARLRVYGDAAPLAALEAALPALRTLPTDGVKACFVRYALLGGSGYVPAACRDTLFMAPLNLAPWLWGAPSRLEARLAEAGTALVLLGPYDGSGYSSGIDQPEELGRVPDDFRGAIWTNRVEVIGPLVALRWPTVGRADAGPL